MKISLLVLASPYASQSADTAWHYAQAAAHAGHELYRVFFYHEAVYHGSRLSVPAQDEIDRVQRWAELAERSGAELVLCVASALKRGILDDTEANRYERGAHSIHPAFVIAGLGQLVDASVHSDRLLTFGG
ncbi:MAG: sulfurtransferase complex subunit TusD [Gammaproteobacteria bacterium]|nr:sulfurtransferase complex subunit TusD [Gammaproteobacteria bacterium]